ncbi:MAG: maltose O-acetyltransferase [Thermoleophilaceae bacterium]|nr:maltose O-acetyltransferase [Thermoleophilaceae bacterium]
MIAGELYRPDDPELMEDRRRCRALLRELRTHDGDAERHKQLLTELLGHLGDDASITPPFACDYGYNISLGAGTFVNFDAVFLDCAPITVGERAQIGPAVQLLAADHPLDPQVRREGLENAKPISIGADAWLGGGAIVLPGRSVGDGAVIGAGSVVTRDVPAHTVAAGNPCRVLRER